MANPVWQSVQTGSFSGNTLTVTKPTGTASGDLLIGHAVIEDTGIGVTPPSGWVQAGTETRSNQVFYKIAGASEPANYAFTGSSGITIQGAVHRITGNSTTSWVISAVTQGRNVTTSASLTLSGGITPMATNTLLMSFSGVITGNTYSSVSIVNNNPTWTVASSNTNYGDSYGNYAPATSTGDIVVTWNSSEASDRMCLTFIAIAQPFSPALFGSTFSIFNFTKMVIKIITTLFGASFVVLTQSILTGSIWNRQSKSSSGTWTTQNKSIL